MNTDRWAWVVAVIVAAALGAAIPISQSGLNFGSSQSTGSATHKPVAPAATAKPAATTGHAAAPAKPAAQPVARPASGAALVSCAAAGFGSGSTREGSCLTAHTTLTIVNWPHPLVLGNALSLKLAGPIRIAGGVATVGATLRNLSGAPLAPRAADSIYLRLGNATVGADRAPVLQGRVAPHAAVTGTLHFAVGAGETRTLLSGTGELGVRPGIHEGPGGRFALGVVRLGSGSAARG